MFKFNNRKFWDSAAYREIMQTNQILRNQITALDLRIWIMENPKKFKCGDIVMYVQTGRYTYMPTLWGGTTPVKTEPSEPVKCKVLCCTPTLYGWRYKTIEVNGCTVREHTYEEDLTLVKKKKKKKK